MVVFALDEVRKLLYLQNNIRNISVIAHIDHGKSTLTDSLVAAAGVTSVELASDQRLACQDESDRSTSSKSAIHTLGYEMPGSDFKGYAENRDGNRYLITLIDSPGHVDFSPEATTALRITDGALVVVDWLEGVSVQTEALLRQALGERIKHVLAVNKLDRCFVEFMLDGEDAYIGFLHAIENANAVVATYTDGALGECQVDPIKGTVAFSSGLHGWAFTLTTFARMYASKFGTDEAKMMERLWGDNFFDPATEKWTKNRTESKTCQRGFVRLIYEPIRVLIKACMDDDREKVCSMTDNLGIRHLLKPGDWKLVGKPLMKRVMQTWLPAQNALLEMIIAHLPSPATAQKYRVDNLYEGPLDDPYAVAMRECDPQGPLMVYISNIIPASEKGQFYALGRVFSGRISTGQKVRIMGSSYKPGTGIGLHIRNVQGTVLCMGTHQQTVETVPCGNIVALAGLDQCITKNATLSNERNEDAHLIKDMKLSQPSILRVAVEPKVADDLPKLVEGLKMLSKFNPGVQCSVQETGEHIIAGTGELHLGMCIKDLKETCMIGADIQVSDTIVSFKETVTSESDHTCMTRTPNKHNRIFMKARPMEEGLAEGIENGKIGPTDDVHARSRILTEQFGWDEEKTRKIWAFSPDTTGPNLLLDATKGVKLVGELMCGCIFAFQWCSLEGVLAEENLRGCIFEIIDAHLHSCSYKRGKGQIIPASRRAMYASAVTAMPRLMEPIYLVQIQAQENALKDIHSVLSQKRGRVFEQFQRPGTHTYSIKAFVPTREAFGLASTLRAKGAQSFPQSVFDHWEIFPHDPLILGSPAALLVESIRKRKGLTPRPELDWICPCLVKP